MLTDGQIMFRLILAAILSGLIGLEREAHGRAAGLRTHILVGVGSALIMLISIYTCSFYKDVVTADPTRIAAGVVTGIGFLGAGTIIRSRTSVIGLTTAASLWVAAGIGLAVGVGLYRAAYAVTALVLVVLVFLRLIENYLVKK